MWEAISTLDDDMDRALGGGIPAGYITEVTGERYASFTLLPFSALPCLPGLLTKTQFQRRR